ncbi:MAG TPA: glycosyltransferase family 1 protein [Vicinamibacterales bacterium]|nr:glycosyltransferase family 1 protein [Vicinamibacterales bacterium]
MADRQLRIGVDGRELTGQPTGVGRYLESILREWSHDASFRHQVTIFAGGGTPPPVVRDDPRFVWRVLAAPKAGTWWEQTTLARAVNGADLDVFFAAGYTAPLRLACPLVVAIYDVSFFAHPEWFSAREGWRRRWLTRSAARRARRVVTISDFSASEIVHWLGIPRDRVVIARPGGPAPLDSGSAMSRPPVVLFVGSIFTRRHVPELIQAFARAATRVPDAKLVLVGANRSQPRIDPRALAQAAGVGGKVEWREYVPDAELDQLYAGARVFAFLSDYEGFGLTPLEAIAHGVPPVLIDTPIAREIFGEAARLVPLDVDRIAAAIVELLSDANANAALAATGRRRLGQYSWTQAAATVRQALEAAASR